MCDILHPTNDSAISVRERAEEVLQEPQRGGDGVPGTRILQVWQAARLQDHLTQGLSVCLSVCLSVRLSHPFRDVKIELGQPNFSMLLPTKKVVSGTQF